MRHRQSSVRIIVLGIALMLQTGCVKKSTHQATLADLGRARDDIGSLEERVAAIESEREAIRADMQAAQQRHDSIQAVLRDSIGGMDERRQLALIQFQTARDEADRMRTLLSQRGAQYESLQQRLESLQAVEQEVRERNAIYQDVIGRFRSLMDGGQLSVAIQRGRMVILLPQDVLFESGSARLGREGQSVITEVASVLAEFPDRRFQVEGHTDNVPISSAPFPSNWELSSARALAVVRLLETGGVAAENLSGAAYGEHQPVASNEDRDSRRLNRRIEIVMLPNLDVIAETQLPGFDD
jgi:chemotaxis protein MotB